MDMYGLVEKLEQRLLVKDDTMIAKRIKLFFGHDTKPVAAVIENVDDSSVGYVYGEDEFEFLGEDRNDEQPWRTFFERSVAAESVVVRRFEHGREDGPDRWYSLAGMIKLNNGEWAYV